MNALMTDRTPVPRFQGVSLAAIRVELATMVHWILWSDVDTWESPAHFLYDALRDRLEGDRNFRKRTTQIRWTVRRALREPATRDALFEASRDWYLQN